jgi:two-component system sensor histidine kinase SenX3
VAALSQILDVLPDAAAIVDDADRVLASSANCIAMGLVSLDRIAPVEVRALNREVHRLSKTQSRDVVIKRNGSRLGEWEARIQISPIDSELSLLIAQDLSEERRLNDVRRDFVANVSHELKTPVGALSLLAEAVQAADSDIEQVRHFTSRMQIEVKRLTAMISDLVALSQVQGDAPLRNSVPVDVAAIIGEAVDATKIAAEQKGIEVVVSDDVNVGRIFGDEDQLNVALSNLISNAIKYSPSNTRVGVGARRNDDVIEISVTDQGPGIPEESQSRIFERFYRVDPARSRDTGGTGLGLAIVKHVCANHGGDCLVWSQVGQGSTFTLRFPAYQNGAGTPTEVTGK